MPSQLVLDTHVWLWLATSPQKLSSAAREAIEASDALTVSTISCWEIATLAEASRIELDRPVEEWVRQALAGTRTTALAVDSEMAVGAALLARDGFHGDPADRIIYATAVAGRAKLVSKDRRMREFDPRRVVW
jgi:PIN domain nuclease of toxin-antitoxin system